MNRWPTNSSLQALCTRNTFVFLLISLLYLEAFSQMEVQERAWIFFSGGKQIADPGEIPEGFLPESVSRRIKNGVPFPAADDMPLCPQYVQALRDIGAEVRYELRWFNAATVEATHGELLRIASLPFVQSVELFTGDHLFVAAGENTAHEASDQEQVALLAFQRKMMLLDTLLAHGLDGRGVTIAVLDAGFSDADEHPGLKHLFEEGRVKEWKNFYKEKREDVFHHAKHGTGVLGAIAGRFHNGPIGAAPGATFLLARTEHWMREKLIEEDHWFAAMEWADRNGADIISSSLGYNRNHPAYSERDGLTIRITQAAAIAVRKGILVINAAGNEGQDEEPHIAPPADADSVVAVGASYPMFRYRMPFSSIGPNARQVMKPDVSAPGYVLTTVRKGKYNSLPGTSFACPLVTGFAACLMQLHPDYTAMQIRELLRSSGHLYPYYDYDLGYGVPDASRIFNPELPPAEATFTTEQVGDTLVFHFAEILFSKDTATAKHGLPFHYHLAKTDGSLVAWKTERIFKDTGTFKLPLKYPSGLKFRVWFEGYLWEKKDE